MRSLASLFVVGTTLAAFADVAPRCGGPKVVIQEPGQECGSHGPSWRGECRAPAECIAVPQHGRQCTLYCRSDGECKPLGPGFACTAASGDDTSSPDARKLCAARAFH